MSNKSFIFLLKYFGGRCGYVRQVGPVGLGKLDDRLLEGDYWPRMLI